MSALITRTEARERMRRVFEASLDRHIPSDPSQPVRGDLFREWEEQADVVCREVGGAFLETMAELHDQAQVETPGACPHCGSGSTRFLEAAGSQERQSVHGLVTLPRQRARCRSCGRSFSPAGAGVGIGRAVAADAPGGRAGGTGGGDGGL
jgi:hypothetical protein